MKVLILILALFNAALNAGTTWHCSWDAGTDNVGVTGYIITIDDTLVMDVGDTLGYSFVGNDSVCVTVQAYDAAGNVSAPSEVECAQSAQNPYDLNGDGKVTGADVVELRLAIKRDDPSPKYDLNNDGKLTGADLIELRLYIKNN